MRGLFRSPTLTSFYDGLARATNDESLFAGYFNSLHTFSILKLVIVLTKAAPAFFYKAEFIKWLLRFIFSKSVVFPAQAEYSYFTADFRLKIFLYGLRHFRFRICWGINYKCLVSRSRI